MLEKVRPAIERGNGSVPEPDAGLSDGRLALVHRYMIDAEEAEALADAAAERVAARAHEEASAAAAQPRPRAESVEQVRVGADALVAEEAPQRTPAEARTNGVPGFVEEETTANGGPDPREELRARKRLVKADKSAAKKAARELASLEKKEARERRALAKAAARRH